MPCPLSKRTLPLPKKLPRTIEDMKNSTLMLPSNSAVKKAAEVVGVPQSGPAEQKQLGDWGHWNNTSESANVNICF